MLFRKVLSLSLVASCLLSDQSFAYTAQPPLSRPITAWTDTQALADRSLWTWRPISPWPMALSTWRKRIRKALRRPLVAKAQELLLKDAPSAGDLTQLIADVRQNNGRESRRKKVQGALFSGGHALRGLGYLVFLSGLIDQRLQTETDPFARSVLSLSDAQIHRLAAMLDVVNESAGPSETAFGRDWADARRFFLSLRAAAPEPATINYWTTDDVLAKLEVHVPHSAESDAVRFPNDYVGITGVHWILARVVDKDGWKEFSFERLPDALYGGEKKSPKLRWKHVVALGNWALSAVENPHLTPLFIQIKNALVPFWKSIGFQFWRFLTIIMILISGHQELPIVAGIVGHVLGIALAQQARLAFIHYAPRWGRQPAGTPRFNRIFKEPKPGEISKPHDEKSIPSERWIADATDAEGFPTRAYQTLIISDLHLRDPNMRAALLQDLLNHQTFKQLIIVGDLIDYELDGDLPPEQRAILKHIWRLARAGVDVTYIPGNHDERWRAMVGRDLRIGGATIEVRLYAEIRAAITLSDGTTVVRRIHLEHGDTRDKVVRNGKKLQHIGSWAYHQLMELDQWMERERARRGIISEKVFSLLGKKLVKKFLRKFRRSVVEAAQRQGATVAIAGHIHDMEMRYIDGVLYINSGNSQNPLHAHAIGLRADGRFEGLEWVVLSSENHVRPSSLLAAA